MKFEFYYGCIFTFNTKVIVFNIQNNATLFHKAHVTKLVKIRFSFFKYLMQPISIQSSWL